MSQNNTLNYMEDGGGKWVIGGTLDIAAGGVLKTGGVALDRLEKVARVALAAVDTGGGLFAWANPEAVDILVERVILDVTTPSSGACTADVGTTATSATTTSDNLIDGASLASAAKVLDNIDDKGTNGKAKQKLAPGKWVTGSVASGASAGVVGFAYIHYITV